MKALLICDMLADFVDGALANPTARPIVPNLQRLLAHARDAGWAVVFSNDAHHPDDPEIAIWGPHAMAGAPGSKVIGALEPKNRPVEIVSPKRTYGAFDGTDLDDQLKALGVDELVLTGQHTHICVRHTAYGGLIRGYRITVPSDGVCAFPEVNPEEALTYLKKIYGAEITTTEALVNGGVTAVRR